MARLHAIVSSLLFFFYLTLSIIYSPEFLLRDLQSKAEAAENTITVTAVVLSPPVVPIVTVNQTCENELFSVTVTWPQDSNSQSFNIYRNGQILITGLTNHSYVDTRAVNGETYTYTVEAIGTMGPGYAESAPVTMDTMPVCATNPDTVTVAITTFDNKNRSQFTQTPSTATLNPNFSGITNTPNSIISLQIANVVSAQTNANNNGYWNWQVPTNMSPGTYTLTVTSTNPNDPNKTGQTSLTFIILGNETSSSTNSTSSTTYNKKRQPILNTTQTVSGSAFVEFSPKMENEDILQGETLKISLTIENLSADLNGKSGTFFYKLLDEKGNEILSVDEDIDSLQQFLMNKQEITLPSYVKPGQYTLRFGIITEGRTFSKDYRVSVKAKPFIKLGENIQMTYPEFISKIGTMSIFMIIFLVLWPFAFLWETHLYGYARRNISEYNLVGLGYLGEIPHGKKRKERRFVK